MKMKIMTINIFTSYLVQEDNKKKKKVQCQSMAHTCVSVSSGYS